MAKRLAVAIDMLLLESETRAKIANKKAYIHVVGFGLGVWKIYQGQVNGFLETFENRIKCLLPKLKHIGHINFSWFNTDGCGDIRNNNVISSMENQSGIKIFLSRRNPAEKLVIDF